MNKILWQIFFFLLNFRLAYLPSLISFWKIFQTDSTWNVAAYYLEIKLNLLESFNANLWEGDSFKVFIFYMSLNCGGGKIRHCLPPPILCVRQGTEQAWVLLHPPLEYLLWENHSPVPSGSICEET